MGRGPTLCLSLETSVKLPEYTCICGCHPSPLNSPSEGAGSGGTEVAKTGVQPLCGKEGSARQSELCPWCVRQIPQIPGLAGDLQKSGGPCSSFFPFPLPPSLPTFPICYSLKKCKTWNLQPQLLSRCYALCMQTLLVWNVPAVAEGGAVWSFLPTPKLPPVLAVLAPCEVTSFKSVNNCVSREQ